MLRCALVYYTYAMDLYIAILYNLDIERQWAEVFLQYSLKAFTLFALPIIYS